MIASARTTSPQVQQQRVSVITDSTLLLCLCMFAYLWEAKAQKCAICCSPAVVFVWSIQGPQKDFMLISRFFRMPSTYPYIPCMPRRHPPPASSSPPASLSCLIIPLPVAGFHNERTRGCERIRVLCLWALRVHRGANPNKSFMSVGTVSSSLG